MTKKKPSPAESAKPDVSPAWRSRSAVVMFVVLAAVGLVADLLSKHYAFNTLLNDAELVAVADNWRRQNPDAPAEDVLQQFQSRPVARMRISLRTNSGVVFGTPMPRWLVVVATVAAIALVGAYFATSDRRARWAHVALSLVLAGALGNLYDRLFSCVSPVGMSPIRYNVRDFINWSGLCYPYIFNVADAYLVVGVILLGLHWIALERKKKANASAASSRDSR